MLKSVAFIIFLLLPLKPAASLEQAQDFFKRGLDRMEKKEYLKAIGDFTHAISLKPDYADAYYQRAMAKLQFGKEKNYFNAELCYDLIAAMKYGNKDAIKSLNEIGKMECHSIKTATIEPDMTFCLDVNSSSLRMQPSVLTELQMLTQLNLWNNKLESIRMNPEESPYLVHLNLGSNDLGSIGPEIGQFTWLYELNLSKNKLELLPASIGKLQHLSMLNLRNNNLLSLPSGISNLKSLNTLDLSLNFFESLPKEIAELKNLKYLILSGNPIPQKEINWLKSQLPNTEITF